MPQKKRHRRSETELISDLQAKIARLKQRSAQKKAKKDPTLRHISAAVRSIDKALEATQDVATGKALDETRSTLAACLALGGASTVPVSKRRAATTVSSDDILAYVRRNPGSLCGDVAEALGADSKAVGAALKRLREEGAVRSEGQRRGMRYYPA